MKSSEATSHYSSAALRAEQEGTLSSRHPIPQADDVIQSYLSAMGGFDILYAKRSRQDNLAGLVSEFRSAGYSEVETKSALSTLLTYGVPASTKRFDNATWKADLKRQWAVMVKAEYAPVQPDASDKVYGKSQPMNKEVLTDDFMAEIEDELLNHTANKLVK